jgi:hypothetical protein
VIEAPADWDALLDRLMPFHLRVGRDLRLTRVGPLLQRIAPHVTCGAPLFERFELQPSMTAPSFDALADHMGGRLAILRLERPFAQIRGCFVPMPGGQEMLFAGSLWVTDLDQLRDLGLAGSMLPANEPLIDLLMTHRLMMTAQQSSLRAMATARETEARRQIDLLAQVNQRLEEAVRQRTAELERANAELRAALGDAGRGTG